MYCKHLSSSDDGWATTWHKATIDLLIHKADNLKKQQTLIAIVLNTVPQQVAFQENMYTQWGFSSI